jgi:hypothetical protein
MTCLDRFGFKNLEVSITNLSDRREGFLNEFSQGPTQRAWLTQVVRRSNQGDFQFPLLQRRHWREARIKASFRSD